MGRLNNEIIIHRNQQQERNLLALFYAHKLHVEDCVPKNTSSCNIPLCTEIISLLEKYSVVEILEIIRESHVPFEIKTADIPQFSSIDASLNIPYLILASQMEDISYEQMGFLLRKEPRTSIADFKYGENHAKTSASMGLCAINKHRVSLSYLGVAFNELPANIKKGITPKLALFIPLVQNLFAIGALEEDVDKLMSILSESTRKRRIPNVWTLIDCVNNELPYELQIHRY